MNLIKFPLTQEYVFNNILEIDLGLRPIVMGRLIEEASSYHDSERLTLSRREGDKTRWAIVDGSYCLNKEGDFEYEALPSNRTDDFFERCRFDSMEEAYDFCQRWKEWLIAKFHKGIVWGTNTWDDEKFTSS